MSTELDTVGGMFVIQRSRAFLLCWIGRIFRRGWSRGGEGSGSDVDTPTAYLSRRAVMGIESRKCMIYITSYLSEDV